MPHTFRRLLLRLLLLAAPLFVALCIYFRDDPYRVLHSYTTYNHAPVFLDEGSVGWNLLKQNYSRYHYNSFIMGNSCTMAYKTTAWRRHLPADAHPMRLFDNAETIGGIFQKLSALDRSHINIRNILLITDWDTFRNTLPPSGFIHVTPPEVSRISPMKYQLQFVQGFLMPNVLIPYLRHKIDPGYTDRKTLNPYPVTRIDSTNDAKNPHDREIAKQGPTYWKQRKKEFAHKRPSVAPIVIGTRQTEFLQNMAALLRRHHTNVKIVISPNYKQVAINPHDLNLLRQIFGAAHVFDFSGVNPVCQQVSNFYDAGHYRPNVGEAVMQTVYGKGQN